MRQEDFFSRLTEQFPVTHQVWCLPFSPQNDTANWPCLSMAETWFSAERLPYHSGPSLVSVHPPHTFYMCEYGLSPSYYFTVPLHQWRALQRSLVCCVRTGLSRPFLDRIYRDNRDVKLRGHPSHYYYRQHHKIITFINSSNVKLSFLPTLIIPEPQSSDGSNIGFKVQFNCIHLFS